MMDKQDKKTRNSSKMLVIDLLIVIAGIALDQLTKMQVRNTLALHTGIDLIPGVLQFLHHENPGASWGMLKGHTGLFLVIAVVVVLGLGYVLTRIPCGKRYLPMNIVGALILAGAVGNTIDRVQKQTVTDFIYFELIDFPIFNVADIYIVAATITLAALIIFFYKDEELAFLEFSQKSQKDQKEQIEQKDQTDQTDQIEQTEQKDSEQHKAEED